MSESIVLLIGLTAAIGLAIYAVLSCLIIKNNFNADVSTGVTKRQYQSLIAATLLTAIVFAVIALVSISQANAWSEPVAWIPLVAPLAISAHCIWEFTKAVPKASLESTRASLLPERTFMFGVLFYVIMATLNQDALLRSEELQGWFLSLIFYLPLQQIAVDARGQVPRALSRH